jgi:4-amino-4-deoxy-L-arabinose transferase-like glycosyltransferase
VVRQAGVYVEDFDWRALLYNGIGAAALAAVAAGYVNISAILAALTPYAESPGEVSTIEGQIRWGAGVAAAFILLRGLGVFRLSWFRGLITLLRRGDNKNWLFIIFGVALALRLGYAAIAPPPPISDEMHYDLLARNLAAGRGYVEDGVPTAYWPIGYPALIAAFYAAFGPHYLPIIIFQAFLGAATAALAWRLASLFWGEGPARAAGLIVAALPSQLAYAARFFPAVVFGFVAVAASYLILKSRRTVAAAAAGLFTGVGGLAAPVLLPMPGAFLVIDLLVGRGWKRALTRAFVAAAVAAAAVAPWTVRNFRVFGAFVPVSTNGGVILWMGSNPGADGSYNFPLSAENPLWAVTDEVKRDRMGRALALKFVREHPGAFVKLLIPKFANLYASDISAFQYGGAVYGVDVAVTARRFSARLAQAIYALLWLAFLIGLVKNRRYIFNRAAGKLPLAALLATPAYLTAFYLVFHGLDRYHYPMLPFLAIVAAGCIRE